MNLWGHEFDHGWYVMKTKDENIYGHQYEDNHSLESRGSSIFGVGDGLRVMKYFGTRMVGGTTMSGMVEVTRV